MYNKEIFEQLKEQTTLKNYKMMTEFTISLINKLEEKQIEDEEIDKMLNEQAQNFTEFFEGDKTKRKELSRMYARIENHVKTKYNLEQRGNIQGTYMAICIGAGVALGVALSSVNVAFMGAGIAIGAGLGVAVGASMEKKAEDEGRLY